jgi:tetratricopeptide (TPR) repeat protein
MIPDEAKMKYQIVIAEYETTYVAPIAPSKGSLPRSIDPQKVPYTFNDIYKTDTFWPSDFVELSEPFILRDVRGITVRFCPFRYNAVNNKLIICKHLIVRVYPDGIDNVNVKTRGQGTITPEMIDTYERFFLNFSQGTSGRLAKTSYNAIGETGRMLIIAADDFYNSMIPLREWRTRKGHQTILVKCSDVGTTWQAVQSYIQNMYNSSGSVLYVLLVGEGNTVDVPSKSVPYPGGYRDPKDPTYALLAGSDPYPDAYISRISAENVDQVNNQVMRTLNYEINPTTGTWFQKACGIASHEGSPADSTRCNWLRDDLLSYGYTYVDKLYDITSAQPIANAMNTGRGVVNYIGHGDITMWGFNEPYVWPLFSVSDVQNLTNTNLLPFIFSVACEVGSFTEVSTCFAEAWLRSGTKDNPKGAIGFYGSSIGQPWVEPCIAQAEAVDLLVADAKITIGGLCFNGSCKMIQDYPSTGPGVFNTWHIFGDAATHVYTKTPMNFSSVSVTDNGSSITVNAGVSGSTICVSSGNNGATYWNRVDNVSSYTFNTSVRPLYITVTKHNYIPYTAVIGGTFTSNEYWFGNMKVLGNVVVSSGSTLTIDPSTSLTFANGVSLTVNGKLNAIGTADQRITFDRIGTSGNWGSIVLSGSGANNSTISYANIQYGTQIDVLNATNVTIQNCNISNFSGQGINFNGATGNTTNNTITSNNIYHGIVIQNGTVTCAGNIVTKLSPNLRRGVGIFYGGGSGGVAKLNDVNGWNWGICAIWGASPSSYSSYYLGKNNRVINCDIGLMVYRLSYPVFGTPPPSDYMWNSIYNNTNNVTVGTWYSEYSSGLAAYGNWWGSNPPNTSLFSVGANSWFYYNPYLTSDPWSGNMQQSIIASGSNEEKDNLLQKNTILNASDEFNTEGTLGICASYESIFEGIDLRCKGKFKEAKDFFLSYLKKNPDSQAGYVWLYHCYNEETADEIVKYFENMPKSASKDCQLLLSYIYLRRGKVEQAKAINNKIIKEQKDKELAVQAKLNNFYIALYTENNLTEASQLLSEASNTSKLSTSVELELARSLMKSYVDPKNGKMPFFDEGDKEINVALSPEVSSMLLDNYPNPFNPVTTINYQIATISKVSLKVYDILGREVSVLFDGLKESGNYKATFNATHLASGIYFVRLTAIPQDGSEHIIQVKKMLLIK